jgi:hypothetical protein
MPGFNIGGGDGPDHKSEFHRAHRWRIVNIGFPGTPPITASQRRLTLFAQSIQLPSLSFEEEKVAGGASNYYKIAKRASWENVTVKFYDVYGLYKIYKDWQDKIWTPQDGIKFASDYKGTAEFILTDADGEKIQSYKLVNCYPTNISHGDLSYTSPDIKLLTVTYSFDYAEIDLQD